MLLIKLLECDIVKLLILLDFQVSDEGAAISGPRP